MLRAAPQPTLPGARPSESQRVGRERLEATFKCRFHRRLEDNRNGSGGSCL